MRQSWPLFTGWDFQLFIIYSVVVWSHLPTLANLKEGLAGGNCQPKCPASLCYSWGNFFAMLSEIKQDFTYRIISKYFCLADHTLPTRPEPASWASVGENGSISYQWHRTTCGHQEGRLMSIQPRTGDECFPKNHFRSTLLLSVHVL